MRGFCCGAVHSLSHYFDRIRRSPASGKADGWDHRKFQSMGHVLASKCPTPASALGKPFVRHHESSQFMGGSIRRVVLMVSL